MAPTEQRKRPPGVGIYDRPPFWRQPRALVVAAVVVVAAGVTAVMLLL